MAAPTKGLGLRGLHHVNAKNLNVIVVSRLRQKKGVARSKRYKHQQALPPPPSSCVNDAAPSVMGCRQKSNTNNFPPPPPSSCVNDAAPSVMGCRQKSLFFGHLKIMPPPEHISTSHMAKLTLPPSICLTRLGV